MSEQPNIEGWQHRGLVTGLEARAILSYSDETLRQMVQAGTLKRFGQRYTVTSIKRLLAAIEAGEVSCPESALPAAKSTPDRTASIRKRKGTNGRSGSKASDTASKTGTKRRRGFSLPN